MSSCIEIYCLHLLNTDNYLPCLQNYCPDAVVSVMPKRQLPADEPPGSLGLGHGEFRDQLVMCPDRHGAKYCVGFVCREMFSGIESLDDVTSRCALLNCAGGETDYQRCVTDLCC